jgi:hypothetical protein
VDHQLVAPEFRRFHRATFHWKEKEEISVLRIWDVSTKSEFFHPGSQIQGQKDSGSASKN